MNRLRIIFVGLIATFATAWVGLAILPTEHYGAKQSDALETEEIRLGRHVYQQNGCLYCHSQQVGPRNFRSDQQRGWGTRRTVAADYQGRGRALMGTMRTGPDLANVGQRLPSASWQFLHLYDPQLTSMGSNMPPFAFLFETFQEGESGHPDAVPTGDGREIVPNREAKALVAYLLSLKLSDGDRPEAFEVGR